MIFYLLFTKVVKVLKDLKVICGQSRPQRNGFFGTTCAQNDGEGHVMLSEAKHLIRKRILRFAQNDGVDAKNEDITDNQVFLNWLLITGR